MGPTGPIPTTHKNRWITATDPSHLNNFTRQKGLCQLGVACEEFKGINGYWMIVWGGETGGCEVEVKPVRCGVVLAVWVSERERVRGGLVFRGVDRVDQMGVDWASFILGLGNKKVGGLGSVMEWIWLLV